MAIKMDNGIIHFLAKPQRHWNLFQALAKLGEPVPIRGEEGFLLDNGSFINRKDGALFYLNETGDMPINPSILTSEDLW